ncbi:hypothetical protein SAMN05216188_1503 [Lentzea xinjiangensis]|uniref:Uncharacterized protein n=1 Tax=Lentzea xinjiangensis TaxID=402600 RepID=A0A1H9WWL0_9PSEU|nr:hypothetical protein [Lentzea xinjiangensis]SES38225.1 hypothetical protein SAMN05216188_1503 [Lentzea xinjiangensis]
MHTPLQFSDPSFEAFPHNSALVSARQRRRVLDHAVDTGALVLPAHVTGPGGAQIARRGAAFEVKRWAPFTAQA